MKKSTESRSSHSSRSLRGLLLLGGLVLLGLTGDWLGRRMAQFQTQADADRGRQPGSGAGVAEAAMGEARPRSRPDRSVTRDRVQRVTLRLQTLARGGDLSTNWTARAEIDRALAELSEGELAVLFEKFGMGGSGNEWMLAKFIGSAWVARDPDAALSAALDRRSVKLGQGEANTLFAAWAAEDPAAARAWLELREGESGDSSDPALAAFKAGQRGAALGSMFGGDFDRATTELRELGKDAAAVMLREWGAGHAKDPEMRERLIGWVRASDRFEDEVALARGLLQGWSAEDAAGMSRYAEELQTRLESAALSPESRRTAEAEIVSATLGRGSGRAMLGGWLERYSQETEAPPALQQALCDWARSDPDGLEQWFAGQEASPQRAALHASAVPALLNAGKYTAGAAAALELPDPQQRRKRVAEVVYLWGQVDPAGAAAWKAGLDGNDE